MLCVLPTFAGVGAKFNCGGSLNSAGMLQYCDFVEQETVATSDGRIRPDVIIRLPGNRTIVIDAKVPFDAFYESIATKDDVVRSARLKDHACWCGLTVAP